MHNGFINIDNEKMSKSAGNFFTVREIGEKYDLEAVRCFMLAAHYRSPLNFSQELIEQSKSALDRLYTAQANYEFLLEKGGTVDREPNEAEQKFIDAIPAIRERFIACMDDDMNTAGALGAIFDLVKEGNIVAVSGASHQGGQGRAGGAQRVDRRARPALSQEKRDAGRRGGAGAAASGSPQGQKLEGSGPSSAT